MVRTVQRPSRITNENARAEPTTPSRRNSKAVACLGASILGERSWNIELTVSQYGEGDQKYKRTEGRPSRTDDDSLQGLGDGLLASQSLLQKGKRIQNTQAAVRMDNASAPLTDSVRFSGNTATPGSQMPTPPGSSQSSHDSSLADASPAVRPPPLSPSPIKSRPAIGAKRSRGTGAFVGSPALARMSESAQQQASPNPRVRKAGRQSFLEDSTRSGSARPEIFMLLSETGMQEGQPQARSAQAETPAKTKPSRSRTNASPTRRRKSNARWNAGESQGSDSESDLGTEDLTEESFIREVQERRWNPDRMTPDFPVRTRLVWPETDARALTKRGGAQGGATATATEPSGSSATPAGRPASSGSGRKGEVSAIANPASSSKSKGVHRAQQSSAVTSNDAGHGVSRTQRPKSKGKSSTRGTRPRRSTIGNSSRAPAPAAEPALSQEPATPASPSDDPLLLRAATDDEYIDEDADESYIPGKGKGRSGSVKGWVDEGVGPDAEDAPGALGLAHTHFAADTTALNRQEKDLLPPDVRQAWHENWTPYRLRTSSPASGTATAHQSATESPAAPGTSIRRSESPEADAPFFDASAQNQSEDDESDENGGQSSAVYAEVNAIDPARSTFEDDRPNLGSGSLEANTHESGAEAEERAASNSSNDSSRKQADIGDTAGDEDAEYNGDATWNSGWGDGGPGGSAGEVSKDMLSIAGGERPDADSSGEDHEPEGQPEYFSENQAADNLFEGQEAEQYQWGDEHHGFSDSGGEESEPVFLHSGYNPEQDARLDRSDDDSETSDDEGGGEVETDEPDVEEQEQQEDEEKEDDGRSDEDEREQKRWDEEGSQLSDDEDNEATEYAHEEESTAAVLDAHLHRHGLQPESPRRMSPNKSSTGRNISTDLNAAHASNNIVRDDAWVDLSVQAAGSQRASGSGLGLGLRSWQMDDAEDMSRSLSAITHRRALMLAQDAPTPVVEVCSLDPEAAARAAAILKLHHHYIEQGWQYGADGDVSQVSMGGANASAGDLALGTRLYPELPHADGSLQGGNTSSQSALSRSAHSSHARRRLAYERSGTHSEVSLPDLLMDAELDLLERESQSRDESSIESSTAAPKASLDSAVRTPPRALSTKVVPPTPATPFVPGAFPRSRTPTPRRPAVTFEATGPSAPSHPLPRKRLTSHPERWGKDDWRSLDDFFTAQVKHTAQLLMHGAGLSENEARRDAAQNVEAEVVVAAFLHAHGIREEQLEGLWSRAKLLYRVPALQRKYLARLQVSHSGATTSQSGTHTSTSNLAETEDQRSTRFSLDPNWTLAEGSGSISNLAASVNVGRPSFGTPFRTGAHSTPVAMPKRKVVDAEVAPTRASQPVEQVQSRALPGALGGERYAHLRELHKRLSGAREGLRAQMTPDQTRDTRSGISQTARMPGVAGNGPSSKDQQDAVQTSARALKRLRAPESPLLAADPAIEQFTIAPPPPPAPPAARVSSASTRTRPSAAKSRSIPKSPGAALQPHARSSLAVSQPSLGAKGAKAAEDRPRSSQGSSGVRVTALAGLGAEAHARAAEMARELARKRVDRGWKSPPSLRRAEQERAKQSSMSRRLTTSGGEVLGGDSSFDTSREFWKEREMNEGEESGDVSLRA